MERNLEFLAQRLPEFSDSEIIRTFDEELNELEEPRLSLVRAVYTGVPLAQLAKISGRSPNAIDSTVVKAQDTILRRMGAQTASEVTLFTFDRDWQKENILPRNAGLTMELLQAFLREQALECKPIHRDLALQLIEGVRERDLVLPGADAETTVQARKTAVRTLRNRMHRALTLRGWLPPPPNSHVARPIGNTVIFKFTIGWVRTNILEGRTDLTEDDVVNEISRLIDEEVPEGYQRQVADLVWNEELSHQEAAARLNIAPLLAYEQHNLARAFVHRRLARLGWVPFYKF